MRGCPLTYMRSLFKYHDMESRYGKFVSGFISRPNEQTWLSGVTAKRGPFNRVRVYALFLFPKYIFVIIRKILKYAWRSTLILRASVVTPFETNVRAYLKKKICEEQKDIVVRIDILAAEHHRSVLNEILYVNIIF